VEVWRIEEKQTDVNIAVHALKDAYEDPDEQLQIFVTNDTDLCPLLEVLAKMPHVKVGVIPPVNGEKKSPGTNLIDLADWSIREIAEQHLCDSQLPVNIQNSVRPDVKIKGGIRKPLGWYGQSDLAKEIFDILHRSVGKRNKAFRWLEQAPYIANIPGLENLPRPAIEMLDDPKDALLTRRHAIEYAKYCEKKK
jgi:6-hydroxy-3-succinoylpyridine 3-monooxygenase